jgi:hypothetical protein
MMQFQRDGSVLMVSDADNSVTSTIAPGWTSDSVTTAYNAFQATWPLATVQAQKQALLDLMFDAKFDLKAFIRSGSATNIAAAGVGTFLATITNNYRSLRAQIAAAPTSAAVLAIDITSGWPVNP